MKKSIIISLHVLYWGPRLANLISWFFIMERANSKAKVPNSLAALNSVSFLAGVLIFYIFYLWLFPTFLAKKRIGHFVIYGLVIMILVSLISYTIDINIAPGSPKQISDYGGLWYGIFYNSIISGLSGSLLKGFISWYSDIRVKEQLVKKNLQSELALLKAQINPHFLFNTINNIDILIQKDAKAASRYLNQLSDMMRFMLYETSSELIPLAKELEYIEKYIELQKIRTSNEKYVNLTISGSTENLKIAPAIFIPFIENAFKHSTNKKIENAINIAFEIEKNEITFTCLNYFENSETFKQAESGLGIDLIKQRLHLLYNENHTLDIVKKDNQFEVKLKIKTA